MNKIPIPMTQVPLSSQDYPVIWSVTVPFFHKFLSLTTAKLISTSCRDIFIWNECDTLETHLLLVFSHEPFSVKSSPASGCDVIFNLKLMRPVESCFRLFFFFFFLNIFIGV